MRSRRTVQEETARIARRRLELLTAELAGIRSSLAQGSGPEEGVAAPERPAAPAVAATPDAELPSSAVGAWPSELRPSVSLLEGVGVLGEEPLARGRHALRPVSPAGRLGSWVYDRLPPTLQGRVRLTAGHLSVVALLVAAGFAVTAWWVIRADGGGSVVPAATWSEPTAGEAAGEPTTLVTPVADGASEAPTAGQGTVVVDIAGKVRRPGIATLPAGSRVVDALEAAGGAKPGVDLTALNLARVLVDGEQIVVGIPPPGGVAAPAASAPGAPASSSGPLVNINSATQAQLEELPGVGPVTAGAIIEWRTDNGAFTSVDELLEVSGIGDATLAKIAPFVTL
ncbi:MAG TPA: ComEA family DNA-binding protein [Pedococcus sp.]|nr:ComEA family DNA-binding protein [Pedococcus sp.]